MKKYTIVISCIGTSLKTVRFRKSVKAGCFGIEKMATALLTSLMVRYPENDDWCIEDIVEAENVPNPFEDFKPQVIDAIDDKVYRMDIWNSEIPPCANKTRAVNRLKAYDIITIGDLLKHSPNEVMGLRNVGVKAVEYLQMALREKYNINWY